MQTLFDKFGGVRPMADHLSLPPSTVQSWKTAGQIPAGHQPAVLNKAQELGLGVDAEEVIFPLGRSLDHVDDDAGNAAAPSSGNSVQVSAEQATA